MAEQRRKSAGKGKISCSRRFSFFLFYDIIKRSEMLDFSKLKGISETS